MKMTVLATAGLIALAGCSGGKQDEGALNETGDNANAAFVEENAAAPAPPPANATNTVAPAAPPPAFTDEQQMRDDADASGLTARLPDGEPGTGDTANQTRPVEK